MNFNSILFSTDHSISPFKINYNNKEFSIEDKKIQTIALSILIGIFTAGIGGIIFFYCLTAKYKVEQLSNNSIDSSTKKIQNKLSDKDHDFINKFVSSFLHPYITGQITAETDLKDRKPMIELLQEKMSGLVILKKDVMEEFALNAFIETAALGLYINQKKGRVSVDITPKSFEAAALGLRVKRKIVKKTVYITTNSPEFQILVKAISNAIPREFPNRQISPNDLKDKVTKALNIVNMRRERSEKEAFSYRRNGNADLRIKKLEQLNKSGKLFL